jgi:hypothetical protein
VADGSIFACINCERTLRNQFATMHVVDLQHLVMNAGNFSGVHRFFDESKLQALYATTFPFGPSAGAMIDFGRAGVLECFLPYSRRRRNAAVRSHALRRQDAPSRCWPQEGHRRAEIERCKAGMCRCDMYPAGWVLPRPAACALLGTTDSFLNDHGRQLPGLVGGSWALVYDTLSFMRQLYFNATFTLPKREESREARANRRGRGLRDGSTSIPSTADDADAKPNSNRRRLGPVIDRAVSLWKTRA